MSSSNLGHVRMYRGSRGHLVYSTFISPSTLWSVTKKKKIIKMLFCLITTTLPVTSHGLNSQSNNLHNCAVQNETEPTKD